MIDRPGGFGDTTLIAVAALVCSGCAPRAPATEPLAGVSLPPAADSRASVAPIASTTAHPPEKPAVDPEFVRSMALTRNFRLGSPKWATPTPDGKSVVFLRSAARDPRQSLWELDVASGTSKVILTPEAVAKGPETMSAAEKARRERLRITGSGFTALELSDDGSRMVVTLSGRAVVIERATAKFRELDTGVGSVLDPRLSHDGKRLAYVRDNDLYTVNVDGTGAAAPVTKGGTELKSHGMAEFVAQEEFERTRGYWWSPDGARFLYEEADSSKVEQMSIVDLSHPEKAPDRPAYPRPGKTNADVKLGLVSSRGGPTTWVSWDRAKYPYVTNVVWSSDGPPTIYVMDRLQRQALLLAIDPANGHTTQLLEERDEAWVNLDSSVPKWLPDSTFLWSTERSGRYQLELHDKSGKLVKGLLQPDFAYQSLLDVDPKRHVAWVQGSNEPSESRVYAIDLATSNIEPIASGVLVKAMFFGRGHDLVTTYEATAAGDRVWNVRNVAVTDAGASPKSEAKVVAVLPSVAEKPSTVRPVTIEKVGVDDIRVAIVRPRGFDPGKKYPVIDDAYGGPHVAIVSAAAVGYARSAWIADAASAIVVSIDAKGTPGRGRDWERAIKNSFADTPLEGHIAALKALGEKHPEMDLGRVGVFGWSFGGYYSALAVLKRPDFYKVSVSGAPVCDWRDYDTAYTERYLGLPDAPGGIYDKNAVQTYATKPSPGDLLRPMLIAHGTADDNVFFINSLKLVDALTRAGRPFEFMPISGVTHQLAEPDMAEAFWSRAASYLRDRLHTP